LVGWPSGGMVLTTRRRCAFEVSRPFARKKAKGRARSVSRTETQVLRLAALAQDDRSVGVRSLRMNEAG
jgi:hypothetical protein